MRKPLRIAGYLSLFVALVTQLACTKVLVHGRDKDYDPVSKLFNTSVEDAMKVGREALVRLGYKIERDDTDNETILTNWQSAKPTSHYIDLFDHRDYGTVGAYYRIKLQVSDTAGRAQVSVSAPTRALVSGRLRTSYREEKRVLKKMTDLLRKDDFEMTNVQTEE